MPDEQGNPTSVRLLVCGDRNWTDEAAIKRVLSIYREWDEVTVIHGNCRGADKLAGKVARELGFKVEEYNADWETYGKAAGPIRNQQMLDEGKPEYGIAFHADLASSKGTKDMVTRLTKAGIGWVNVED